MYSFHINLPAKILNSSINELVLPLLFWHKVKMSGKVAGLLALSKLVEVEGQSKAKKVCVNYDEND